MQVMHNAAIAGLSMPATVRGILYYYNGAAQHPVRYVQSLLTSLQRNHSEFAYAWYRPRIRQRPHRKRQAPPRRRRKISAWPPRATTRFRGGGGGPT